MLVEGMRKLACSPSTRTVPSGCTSAASSRVPAAAGPLVPSASSGAPPVGSVETVAAPVSGAGGGVSEAPQADRSRAAARSGAALPRVVRSTLVLPGPGQNVDRVVGPAGCGAARSVGYRWRPGRPSAPRRIRGTGRVQREYDMAGTGRKLVLVESPAKARKIGEYLVRGYTVDASVGHIRDLLNPSQVPAGLKKGSPGQV